LYTPWRIGYLVLTLLQKKPENQGDRGKRIKQERRCNMMKIKEVLKKFGVKNAEAQIDPRSAPRVFYQPKPPAKIQEKMDQANKNV